MSGALSDVVGKTPSKVLLSQDKELLSFTFDDGTSLTWSAVGDCCSSSWFESVESFDFNGAIRQVEMINGPEREDGELKIYFCTIYSVSGRLCIEMRNSSNGYYGGWIEVGEKPLDQYGRVREDEPMQWTAVP